MENKTFTFTTDEHEITVTLQSPEEGSVLFEQLNPWSEKRFAALIPVEQFVTDFTALLPDRTSEDLDSILFPRLMETLTNHVKQYGHLADSDYCTYINYFYLLHHHLAKAAGIEPIGEEDQKGAMLGFYEWLSAQKMPLERTGFRDL